jgi:hypothetical protein
MSGLALLMLTIALVCGAYQVRVGQSVLVGAGGDEPYIRGMYAAERNAGGGHRWTEGESAVILPGLGGGPYRLTLRLAGDANPRPRVVVRANGREIGTIEPEFGFRDYSFEVPAAATAGGDITIGLASSTFAASDDDRQLGVALAGVALAPTGAPGLLPPATGPFLSTLAIVASVWGVAILAGGVLTASVLGGGAALALAAALIVARPATALRSGDLTRVAVVTLTLALGLWVALALARRLIGPWPGLPPVAGDRRVVVAYALVTLGMTWPLAARLADALPPGRDAILQVWIARWVQHALVTDPLGLYDANYFYPLRNTLAYSDSNVPGAIMAAPAFLLTGNALLANNLLALGTFVLAAGGMYLLAGRLAGNPAVAFLAGLAYAFLPYRYAHLRHLQQLGHAWTPWAILALLLLIERRSWRAATAFGLLAALLALTSFYLAFQLALIVAVVLGVAAVAVPEVRSTRFLGRLVVAGLLTAAIVLPFALPYLRVRDDQGLERSRRDAELFRATPEAYRTVYVDNRLWGRIQGGETGVGDRFPGLVTLLDAGEERALYPGTRSARKGSRWS